MFVALLTDADLVASAALLQRMTVQPIGSCRLLRARSLCNFKMDAGHRLILRTALRLRLPELRNNRVRGCGSWFVVYMADTQTAGAAGNEFFASTGVNAELRKGSGKQDSELPEPRSQEADLESCFLGTDRPPLYMQTKTNIITAVHCTLKSTNTGCIPRWCSG